MKLSTPQKNIWNLQKYYENTSIANICGALIYDKQINADILQDALSWVVCNHDSLRLSFTESDGIPTQQVNAPKGKVSCEIRSFQSKAEFDEYANVIARKPFGMNDYPLYRFFIAYYEDNTAILLCLHHLIADAWTVSLLAKHVDEAYQAIASESVMPNVAHKSYMTFLDSEENYIKSERFEKDRVYWQSKYEEKPQKSLIKLRNENEVIYAEQTVSYAPADLSKRLLEFSGNHRISVPALFEAAMILYLAHINEDQDRITIGVPVLNRSTIAEKQTAGMFISIMPLSVRVCSEDSVSDFLQSFYAERSSMYRHQKYPLTEILRYIREKHGSYGELYDVMVSFQNAETGVFAHTEWYSNGASELPLQLHIDQRDGEQFFRLTWCYQTAIFKNAREVLHLSDRICCVLSSILQDINQQVRDVQIVPEKERQLVVEQFNDTRIDYNRDATVHGLFSAQAQKMPDRVALVFQGHQFTYRELDEMSNSVAHELRQRGVQRFSKVPIICERSWQMIVASLAVLKAGGAYIPIDPTYPDDRINYMLSLVQAPFVLSYEHTKTGSFPNLHLDEINYYQNTKPLSNTNSSQDDCYIIFTSGSSGIPKGVTIRHKNVINFANSNSLNVCHKIINHNVKTILCLSSFSFDMSITETLLPLINGLTIILADDKESMNPRSLAQHIGNRTIDIIESTPTKLSLFFESDSSVELLRQAKAIIVGGEALIPDFLSQLKKINKNIFNNYGPAETTVWSTIKEQTDNDITIGKPIANTQIYIVDSYLKLVPIGVAGELCIAGDGVGAGYYNRPELTAEKFISNLFATEENGHGKIMYRTGDLARWREDGEIEFLGRIDTQVKIHGLRIELGEIESEMSSFPGIQLSAATDKKDENGRQYLVGYYTAEESVDEQKLREHMKAKLPRYMIPNYFVHLDAMPITTSGKIDRKRLPKPLFVAKEDEYIPPETQMQKNLCTILSDLLKKEQVGQDDDFFELGGDSLAAILYSTRAADLDIRFTIQDVYNHSTVRDLSAWLNSNSRDESAYVPEDCDRYKPLLERNRIESTFQPVKKNLGNVLLTGATGFLGAHILDALMRSVNGKIYCLVRGTNQSDSESRLRERLRWYFDTAYEKEIGCRLQVLCGDVTSEGIADQLPDNIQTIIHAAASVKHYGNYDYFHGINTIGTRHMTEFAKRRHARMIHISTISVSGNSMVDDFNVYHSPDQKTFSETDLYIGQPLDNVYVRSKFEAERCVLDAMLEGLDAVIIRVGNLTNRVSDLRFQPNYSENAFLSRVKALLELGKMPDYLMPLYAEFSPVDLTADGIVRIAQNVDKQTVFHLYSHRPLYFTRMLEFLHRMGIQMEVESADNFLKSLKSTLKDRNTEYIYEALQRDMDDKGRLVYDTNIRIENRFTHWFMEKAGFDWSEIDETYLKAYIEYFRKLGYLHV